MRPSFFVRLGIAACGTLALCLLSVAIADASPAPRRAARIARTACDSRPMLRRCSRGRPGLEQVSRRSILYLLRTQKLVRHHPAEWLERQRTSPLRDTGAAALQSNVAAVDGEGDLQIESLRPLGILFSPPTRITVHGSVTPRSPRGPPAVTCFV
jgi:hypothetical protein